MNESLYHKTERISRMPKVDNNTLISLSKDQSDSSSLSGSDEYEEITIEVSGPQVFEIQSQSEISSDGNEEEEVHFISKIPASAKSYKNLQ